MGPDSEALHFQRKLNGARERNVTFSEDVERRFRVHLVGNFTISAALFESLGIFWCFNMVLFTVEGSSLSLHKLYACL